MHLLAVICHLQGSHVSQDPQKSVKHETLQFDDSATPVSAVGAIDWKSLNKQLHSNGFAPLATEAGNTKYGFLTEFCLRVSVWSHDARGFLLCSRALCSCSIPILLWTLL